MSAEPVVDEPTPVVTAVDAARGAPRVATPPGPPSAEPAPADVPERARPPWRLPLAACAAALAATALTLDPEPRQPPLSAAAPAGVPSPPPSPRPRPPVPPAARAPRTPPPRPLGPPPAPRSPQSAVDTAVAHYLAGDLGAAQGALSGATEPGAIALVARLGALAGLVGDGVAWPPPGGAAALERLLDLDRAVTGGRPSPIAARARRALAARLAEKGHGLAHDRRWDEAAAAFRAALARDPGAEPAWAGLQRVEAAAEALYLEGYAREEDDPGAARRLYLRASRLCRPDGPLARRVAERLGSMGGP